MRALLAAALIGANVATAQAPTPRDSIVVTHGQVTVGGTTLRYTTRAGLLPLLDNDTAEPMARLFFVSYTVDRSPGAPARPLTFIWNGGPGSNAAQLHVAGFGPKRIKTADTYTAWGPNTETELVDNPETWLGVSDLVFLDPAGTGFSRATTTEYRDILYTDRGDTEAAAEFIRVYLNRFNGWSSPLFIAGESYGTTRAMGVAEALERRRTHLAGVVLISGFYSMGQRVPSELNQALQLPMYTAMAHYHRRLAPELQALPREEAVKRATEWARSTYASALARRDNLSAGERTALLANLQRFTGIEPAAFDQKTLTISKDDFSDKLLASKGLELGRYDSRMTIKSRPPNTPWLPVIDPSLMPMIDLMQGTSRLFNSYIRDTLQYRNDLLYRGPFGEAFYPRPLAKTPAGFYEDWMTILWNRAGRGSAPAQASADPPPLRRAMELNPKLIVLNATGLYDASCAARDEAVARTDAQFRNRVTNRCYVGGHMMYSELATRREMVRDFSDFVRTAQRQNGTRAPGSVDQVWKPVRDGGADVVAIDVRTELRGLPDSTGSSLSLTAPVVYAGVTGIADRIRNLALTDANGVVPLETSDDPPTPGGFPYYRHWRTQRAVKFPAVFTYRALVQPPDGRGPPFGIKAFAGGVSGAGCGFLVLPELGATPVASHVHWDLSDLASGSTAVTTFGEGDFALDDAIAEVGQGWLIAGPLGRYPEHGPRNGFSAAWLGVPSWDPAVEMKWAEQMYQSLAKQYKYLDPPPPYRVFIRVGFNSGTALTRSFMGGAQPRQPGAPPSGQASRGTFTHEMGHMWVGGISGPEGVTSWFSEGLNTYYTRLLPMRGGFTSVEDYGREINRDFRDYYGSTARNLSADSIVRIGFGDEKVRHIPYVRGSLYFADLDSKIRAYSKGKRNLDKVLFDLFQARELGAPFTHETWKEIVEKEAGPGSAEAFERIILRGETVLPASDAFGPCFERRPTNDTYEWVRVASIPDEKCREPW